MSSDPILNATTREALRLKDIDAGEILYPIICCLSDNNTASATSAPPALDHFLQKAGSPQLRAMLRYLCTGNTTSPFKTPTTPRERLLKPTLDELCYNIHEELYDTVETIVTLKGGDAFIEIVLGRLFK